MTEAAPQALEQPAEAAFDDLEIEDGSSGPQEITTGEVSNPDSFDITQMDEMFGGGNVVDIPDSAEGTELVKEVTDEHYLFESVEIVNFLKTVAPAASAGSNIYDKSILIKPTEDPKVCEFVFSSFGIVYRRKIESTSPSPDHLCKKPVIVDIKSLAAIIRYSGNHCLLFARDNGLFASIFGGEAFVTAYFGSDLSPFQLDQIGKVQSGTPVDVAAFSSALGIAAACKSTQSAQQKILFFGPDGAFVNPGGVFIRFKATFPKFSLQPRGINVLKSYFSSGAGEVMMETSETTLLFDDGDSFLSIEKVPEELPQPTRDMFGNLKGDGVQVSLKNLVGISQVLSASAFEGGVLHFHIAEAGVELVSTARDGADLSRFPLGAPSGPTSDVSISVASIRDTLTLFKGSMNVSLSCVGEMLNVSSGNMTALIAGRERR